jgi:hypothetical protein
MAIPFRLTSFVDVELMMALATSGQQRIHQRDKSTLSVVTFPHVTLTHVLRLELREDMIEVIQEFDKVLRSLHISLKP